MNESASADQRSSSSLWHMQSFQRSSNSKWYMYLDLSHSRISGTIDLNDGHVSSASKCQPFARSKFVFLFVVASLSVSPIVLECRTLSSGQ